MNRSIISFRAFSLVALALAMVCGCEKTETRQADSNASKPIPKQWGHLPKTYPQALARMRELFDVVNGEGELPDPISYQVREVMHGTGAGAHSHFYPVKADEQDMDDDGHETVGEKIHTIVVDWSSELSDLAKKLPKIAVDGDMEEATWKKVKELSSTLSEEFKSLSADSSDDARRDALRKKSEAIEKLITELESYLA